MAIRKRTIDPHIWEDPDFNKLSHQARFLYIGTISNADDYGYIRADSGSLKRIIFGFDEIKKEEVEKWRKEIEDNMKNTHFFEIKKEVYAHHLKWPDYQKQQKDRMQPSTYPLCSKCLASDKQVQPKVKEREVKEREVVAFSFSSSLKEMHESKDRPTEIVSLYWEARGITFENTAQLESALERDIVWAKKLTGYTNDQIKNTMKYLNGQEFWKDKWDLKTINNKIDK